MTSIIDLYVFDLEIRADILTQLHKVLSEDELARASRMLSSAAGNRYVVARGMMRHILASYSNQRANDLVFNYGPHGKPFLSGARDPLYFNLSHSGHMGAIAVSTQFEIGVDVQVWRSVRAGLAERFFSRAEATALEKLNGVERKAAFFRCWTRKEAVIKALGDGLSRSLKSFAVSLDDLAKPDVLSMDGEEDSRLSWSLFSFSPQADISGAVACKNCGRNVELRHREFTL